MRLVTYDRAGARRLGAWVGDTVVDLPDAVGHPAFPTTMEALLTRHGGTVLDAARHVLASSQDIRDFAIEEPRLLVPIIPASLLEFESEAGPSAKPRKRTLFGPGEQIPWPPAAGALDYGLELACVLGKMGSDLSPPQAARLIFGYMLKVTWSIDRQARKSSTRETGNSERDFATCLGPCVVTRDEFDPTDAHLSIRIDGRTEWDGNVGPVRRRLADMIAHVSKESPVCPGEIFGLPVGSEIAHRSRGIRPGAKVEISVEGLGELRTRVGRLPRARKHAAALSLSRPALAH
jgi:hypothetical protein